MKKRMVPFVLVLLLCAHVLSACFSSSDSENVSQYSGSAPPGSDPATTSQAAQNLLPATIYLSQTDTKDYPTVRLYFRVEDQQTQSSLATLQNMKLSVLEDGSQKAIDAVISPLNQYEQKNVCFVMDISGSMAEENRYMYAQDAIQRLLDQMQGLDHYFAVLVAFNDTQNMLEDFTQSYATIRSELNATKPGGQTAFWDTLEISLMRTNQQPGQKCIIAATDGIDNASRTTKDRIITLSQQLNIPIYIITFDSSLKMDLQKVARQTGGDCYVVSQVSSISQIYDKIFEQQKNTYRAEYVSDGLTTTQSRSITLNLLTDTYQATTTDDYQKTDMTLLNSAAYAHIMNITASSHLEEYFRSTGYLYHVPNNVTDGSYRTAWVENAPGDGIGEWIQLTFDQPYTINGIEISNGYKKSQAHYQKNSRLRKMRLHFSDGSYQDYNLQDTFAGASASS